MEILTLKEVSSILKVKVRTIRQWIIDDGFPYMQTKKGGKLFFIKDDVFEWIDSHRNPPI